MRTITLFSLAVIASLCFSCNNDETSSAVIAPGKDTAYAADSVSLAKAIDSLHTAFKKKSIEQMNLYFSEDGTYIGTDPTEFWTREELNQYLTPSFSRDSTPSEYAVTKRAIEMSSDKKTAVVVDQFSLPFSPKLPVRSIAFAEYRDNRWTIKMFSWSFIANNADVNKLNDALK